MADKKEKSGFFGSIKNFFTGRAKYFKEVKAEMKKIVWPSKSQIINNTLIVIAVTLIAAVFLFGLDTVLVSIVSAIYKTV